MNFVLSEHFSDLLISSAALTLIHFLWQGTLVALLLRLFFVVIPGRLFQIRYRLAVFALFLNVLIPLLTFNYLINSLDMTPSISDFSMDLKKVDHFNSENNLLRLETSDNEILKEPQVFLESFISSYSSNNLDKYFFNIVLVWFVGFFLMSMKFIRDLNNTYQIAKTGVLPVNEKVNRIIDRLVKYYRLSSPIKVFKSSMVKVPLVVGWLRPVILLPIAITVGLDNKQLELILAHELAHIKRSDFAVNLMQSVVQICFFYHPAIYWINQVIKNEREFICDAMALNALGNNEQAKLNLAKALLNTEELRDGNFPLIAVAASDGKLTERISHIIETKCQPSISIKTIFIGVTAFAFSLAAMASALTFNKSVKLNSTNVEGFEKVDRAQLSMTLPSLATIQSSVHVNKPIENNKLINSDIDSKLGLMNSATELVERSSTVLVRNNLKKPSKASKLLNNGTTLKANNKKAIINPKINTTISNEINTKSLDFNDLPMLVAFKNKPLKRMADLAIKNDSNNTKVASLDLRVASYSEPKAIYTPYPTYPRRAWSKMINQTVKVEFAINDEGYVVDIRTRGEVDRDFAREIRRKLRKWKYEPATKNGENVRHLSALEFVFRAPQKEKILPIQTGSRIRR